MCLCTGPVVGDLVVWVEWGCICVSESMYGAGGRWYDSLGGLGMYISECVWCDSSIELLLPALRSCSPYSSLFSSFMNCWNSSTVTCEFPVNIYIYNAILANLGNDVLCGIRPISM